MAQQQQQERARRQPQHRQQQQQQQQQGHPQPEQPQMHNPTFHLRVSRKEAAKELQSAAKIGQAIRGQRIRDMRDLDEARREKQEWHLRTMEMLARIVSTEAWCEEFNDFVATILPEYAEFGMFVDVFEEEMRHRLGKLQALYKELVNVPEPGPLQPHAHRAAGGGADGAAAGRAQIAQVLDGALAAQPDAAFVDESAADANARGADDAAPAEDAEPELETIYQPPEATMPQVQQQQQQQQLQQQQQQTSRQTVAASILHDPAQHPRIASPSIGAGAAAQTCGALIARTNDEPAAQAIAQFMEKLNVVIRLIDRTAPTAESPLIDQLNSQSGSRFVLMLVDANSAGTASGDDLFDLGCCVGRMGPDRVFALHRGGDATPDRYGIAHVPIDDTEGWQLQLARLLKKAGVNVDLNKLM
jgi:hypothetical protein